MWQRISIGILLALAAVLVIRYFSNETFTNWDSIVSIPAPAPPIREPPTQGDMDVAGGGPNPPNAAAPRMMKAQRLPPPEASDPLAETVENADAPETLRHPERSFSPGIVPEQTQIAVDAGLAGPVASSSQAFQQFSPDYVQNGGVLFGSVSANEAENPNYSAF
jgi:hypothetical protein